MKTLLLWLWKGVWRGLPYPIHVTCETGFKVSKEAIEDDLYRMPWRRVK